jgi:hypothetical protein
VRALVWQPCLTCASWPGVVSFNPFSQDNWVRRVSASSFLSFFESQPESRRITIQDVIMYRTSPTSNKAGYPADIGLQGGSTLVLRCSTIGVKGSKAWSVATGSLVPGPISVVQYRSYLSEHIVEPHQRYGTGFLLDNSQVGGAFLGNRETAGTGHGWATVNSVLWNVRAVGEIGIQTPPLGFNLCIGCAYQSMMKGSSKAAFVDGSKLIAPAASLFEAQLTTRVGASITAQVLAPLDTATSIAVEISNLPLPQGPVRFVLQEARKCRAFQRSKRGTIYFNPASSPGEKLQVRWSWVAGLSVWAIAIGWLA